MCPRFSRQACRMLLLSVGMAFILGFLLPLFLRLLIRFLRVPNEHAPHAVFLLYFTCLLFISLPYLPRGSVTVTGKAVVITGCDMGFGFSMAQQLHKLGFTVFAGCSLKDKNGAAALKLESLHCNRMRVFQMDVCSEEEVNKALEFVRTHLEDPDQGLWGLVNNAGTSTFGNVEFTSLEMYQQMADVNLWGTIRATKAFLPLVRKSKGRVVCMASMLGRIGSPSRSSYCVSKYGVEAFSDCLRQEMYKWRVKVITIEPGNFLDTTGIFTRQGADKRGEELWDNASEGVRSDYGRDHLLQQVGRMKALINNGERDVTPVLDAITDALCTKYPYTRYNPSDIYNWVKLQMMSHLPAGIADLIYIYIY